MEARASNITTPLEDIQNATVGKAADICNKHLVKNMDRRFEDEWAGLARARGDRDYTYDSDDYTRVQFHNPKERDSFIGQMQAEGIDVMAINRRVGGSDFSRGDFFVEIPNYNGERTAGEIIENYENMTHNEVEYAEDLRQEQNQTYRSGGEIQNLVTGLLSSEMGITGRAISAFINAAVEQHYIDKHEDVFQGGNATHGHKTATVIGDEVIVDGHFLDKTSREYKQIMKQDSERKERADKISNPSALHNALSPNTIHDYRTGTDIWTTKKYATERENAERIRNCVYRQEYTTTKIKDRQTTYEQWAEKLNTEELIKTVAITIPLSEEESKTLKEVLKEAVKLGLTADEIDSINKALIGGKLDQDERKNISHVMSKAQSSKSPLSSDYRKIAKKIQDKVKSDGLTDSLRRDFGDLIGDKIDTDTILNMQEEFLKRARDNGLELINRFGKFDMKKFKKLTPQELEQLGLSLQSAQFIGHVFDNKPFEVMGVTAFMRGGGKLFKKALGMGMKDAEGNDAWIEEKRMLHNTANVLKYSKNSVLAIRRVYNSARQAVDSLKIAGNGTGATAKAKTNPKTTTTEAPKKGLLDSSHPVDSKRGDKYMKGKREEAKSAGIKAKIANNPISKAYNKIKTTLSGLKRKVILIAGAIIGIPLIGAIILIVASMTIQSFLDNINPRNIINNALAPETYRDTVAFQLAQRLKGEEDAWVEGLGNAENIYDSLIDSNCSVFGTDNESLETYANKFSRYEGSIPCIMVANNMEEERRLYLTPFNIAVEKNASKETLVNAGLMKELTEDELEESEIDVQISANANEYMKKAVNTEEAGSKVLTSGEIVYPNSNGDKLAVDADGYMGDISIEDGHTSNIKDIIAMVDVMYQGNTDEGSILGLSNEQLDYNAGLDNMEGRAKYLWGSIKAIFTDESKPLKTMTAGSEAVMAYSDALFMASHRQQLELKIMFNDDNCTEARWYLGYDSDNNVIPYAKLDNLVSVDSMIPTKDDGTKLFDYAEGEGDFSDGTENYPLCIYPKDKPFTYTDRDGNKIKVDVGFGSNKETYEFVDDQAGDNKCWQSYSDHSVQEDRDTYGLNVTDTGKSIYWDSAGKTSYHNTKHNTKEESKTIPEITYYDEDIFGGYEANFGTAYRQSNADFGKGNYTTYTKTGFESEDAAKEAVEEELKYQRSEYTLPTDTYEFYQSPVISNFDATEQFLWTEYSHSGSAPYDMKTVSEKVATDIKLTLFYAYDNNDGGFTRTQTPPTDNNNYEINGSVIADDLNSQELKIEKNDESESGLTISDIKFNYFDDIKPYNTDEKGEHKYLFGIYNDKGEPLKYINSDNEESTAEWIDMNQIKNITTNLTASNFKSDYGKWRIEIAHAYYPTLEMKTVYSASGSIHPLSIRKHLYNHSCKGHKYTYCGGHLGVRSKGIVNSVTNEQLASVNDSLMAEGAEESGIKSGIYGKYSGAYLDDVSLATNVLNFKKSTAMGFFEDTDGVGESDDHYLKEGDEGYDNNYPKFAAEDDIELDFHLPQGSYFTHQGVNLYVTENEDGTGNWEKGIYGFMSLTKETKDGKDSEEDHLLLERHEGSKIKDIFDADCVLDKGNNIFPLKNTVDTDSDGEFDSPSFADMPFWTTDRMQLVCLRLASDWYSLYGFDLPWEISTDMLIESDGVITGTPAGYTLSESDIDRLMKLIENKYDIDGDGKANIPYDKVERMLRYVGKGHYSNSHTDHNFLDAPCRAEKSTYEILDDSGKENIEKTITPSASCSASNSLGFAKFVVGDTTYNETFNDFIARHSGDINSSDKFQPLDLLIDEDHADHICIYLGEFSKEQLNAVKDDAYKEAYTQQKDEDGNDIPQLTDTDNSDFLYLDSGQKIEADTPLVVDLIKLNNGTGNVFLHSMKNEGEDPFDDPEYTYSWIDDARVIRY